MASARHALVAVLLVATLALLGIGTLVGVAGADPGAPTPTETPTETPTTSPTPSSVPAQVDSAVLRWGMTNEANNRAFAPDTVNFFSAGAVPDPGRGGVQLREEQWHQQAGTVSIEKWDGTVYRPATWAGLGTDSAGSALGAPTAGTFSNHTFVFGAGTGTVDVATGVAHLTWDGDVSVLFYSGMSYFVLSDPVLDVAGGQGQLSATLSGYASSQEDPTAWAAVPAQEVTVATLPSVDLSDPRGFVTTPAYAGVRIAGLPQVTTGAAAGSFPQPFVDYQNRLGSAPFWYSSGSSTDAFKVALPITVSLSSADPVQPATPTTAPSTKKPKPVHNSAPPPPPSPAATVTQTVTAAAPPVVPPAVAPPAVAPPAGPAATSADAVVLLSRPETSASLLAVEPRPAWPWWTGGACLLAAALSLLSQSRITQRKEPPCPPS